MSSKSKIEWTGHTWNPVAGCSVLSPGCTNCYAMKMAGRLEAMGQELYKGLTKPTRAGAVWTGVMRQASDDVLLAPLRRKKPTTYFVNSMSDLFHENIPDEWRDPIFRVMALTPQHTYQVLTKRAERMRDYMDGLTRQEWWKARLFEDGKRPYPFPNWPLPNVWLGVSTERQQEADERIPLLLQTPAAVRFTSAEPLLGPLDLKRWMPTGKWGTFKGEPVYHQTYFMTKCEHCGWFGSSELCHEISYGDDADVSCPSCTRIFLCDEVDAKLHWVIAGGESGPSARPMHPDWARSLRDQCKAASVPFFFKQWGAWAPGECALGPQSKTERVAYFFDNNWDFGKLTPAVSRETHVDDGPDVWWFGKKAAGRLLDGAEHNAMPVRP